MPADEAYELAKPCLAGLGENILNSIRLTFGRYAQMPGWRVR